jgi:sec-independent protein translocase protein TatA
MATPSPILAGTIGGMEVWMIFAVVLLLFGSSKIPALAKGLGQAKREFKKASQDEEPPAKPAEVKRIETPPTTPGAN